MSCWCGHGPWHHYGYMYPPRGYAEPDYPEPEYWAPARGRRRGTGEDLERRLAGLEAELARLREVLTEQRGGSE